jgi:hypothetical protein
MSDALSMPALDKVQKRVQIRATTFVRLEALQEQLGLSSLNAIINAGLDQFVENVPFGEKEQRRLAEVIEENRVAREKAKAQKGLV